VDAVVEWCVTVRVAAFDGWNLLTPATTAAAFPSVTTPTSFFTIPAPALSKLFRQRQQQWQQWQWQQQQYSGQWFLLGSLLVGRQQNSKQFVRQLCLFKLFTT